MTAPPPWSIESIVESYGYVGLVLLMATNGYASWPPSELTLGAAGVAVHGGLLQPIPTVLAAVAGNLLGASLLYGTGRIFGYTFLLRWRARLVARRGWLGRAGAWIPNEHVMRYFEDLFRREGGAVWVGALRCFPVVRSIISLPAGMIHMPFALFLANSFVGCAVWASLWIGLGFGLGASWEQWSPVVSGLLLVILVALAIGSKRAVGRAIVRAGGDEPAKLK